MPMHRTMHIDAHLSSFASLTLPSLQALPSFFLLVSRAASLSLDLCAKDAVQQHLSEGL